MVLLRPALRSTASPQTVLRRTIDPSPSSALSGAEHRPPGRLGALACGWVGALLGFAVGLFLREDYRLTLHDGSIEPDTGAPMLRGR